MTFSSCIQLSYPVRSIVDCLFAWSWNLSDKERVDSPFLKVEPVRLGFRTMLLLLLMVVGAGVALLLFHATQVPAITSEFNAWLGRPEAVVDRDAARLAQLQFALFVYIAPLALGMLVYGVHFIVNLIDRSRSVAAPEDDEFRME